MQVRGGSFNKGGREGGRAPNPLVKLSTRPRCEDGVSSLNPLYIFLTLNPLQHSLDLKQGCILTLTYNI